MKIRRCMSNAVVVMESKGGKGRLEKDAKCGGRRKVTRVQSKINHPLIFTNQKRTAKRKPIVFKEGVFK